MSSGDQKKPPHIVGEIEAFDPEPSVKAAMDALAAVHAPFALIGGLALDAWGMSRATKDVDFAVPFGKAEAAAAIIAGADGKTVPLRIGGVGIRDEKRHLRVDLIDRRFHFAPLFAAAIADAQSANRFARLTGRDVPLVSLEYLLAMKILSGDAKDDADVRRLVALEQLDYASARALVEHHLGPATANRLDAFAREAGRREVGGGDYKSGDGSGVP